MPNHVVPSEYFLVLPVKQADGTQSSLVTMWVALSHSVPHTPPRTHLHIHRLYDWHCWVTSGLCFLELVYLATAVLQWTSWASHDCGDNLKSRRHRCQPCCHLFHLDHTRHASLIGCWVTYTNIISCANIKHVLYLFYTIIPRCVENC